MTNSCNCPNSSYGQKHSTECYEAQIERLKQQRHALQNDLTAARLENERMQKALKSVQNLAGGHPIECECRQCEIFELLEPIVGNTSPEAAPEPAEDLAMQRAAARINLGRYLKALTVQQLVEYALAHLETDLRPHEDAIVAALYSRIWPGWEQAPIVGEDAGESEAEPTPCEHLRSELLAEKLSAQPPFEMRKCLDCTQIFRVRKSVRTNEQAS